jgi:hypothetical protein
LDTKADANRLKILERNMEQLMKKEYRGYETAEK